MLDVRSFVRSALFLAALALLAIGGCVMPPIAFHDGLPAWTPSTGRTEGSIGYHRMYWSEGEGSVWYLTPGIRAGLARPPMAADAGLTSVVVENGGRFGALMGLTLGIGYQNKDMSVIARPGAYFMSISPDGVEFGFDDPLWQVSVLGGSRFTPGRSHVSGGGRISRFGVGPALLVGHSVGPVVLRLEGSYTFPYNDNATGRLLTVGLTVGGPAPSQTDHDLTGGMEY